MAIVQPDGSLTGSIGNRTYRKRLGQNVVSTKARNTTLRGVKSMSEEELQKLANRTGYSMEDLLLIQAKQQAMNKALEYCRDRDLSGREYSPSKPGETRFNRCVGRYLKGMERRRVKKE